MKLILLGDDGSVLDSTDEFTRDEWDNLSDLGAALMVKDMQPGAR